MKRNNKKSGPSVNALNTLKTGKILVEAGLVTSKDIKKALAIQEKRKKSFFTGSYSNEPVRLLGTILCDMNLVTPVDLYSVLHEKNKIYTMEQLLVDNEKTPQRRADQLMEEQKRGIYSFFDLVVKYNILSVNRLQQRIFELYRIPYRHVNRFTYNENNKEKLILLLDKDVAYKKRAIPIIRKKNSFIMGITAPETLVFIYNLNFKLPNYRIIPVFIPMQHFKSLYWKLYNISFPDFYSPLTVQKDAKTDKSIIMPVAQTVKNDPVLFFKHKTMISNPEREKHLILDLYSKYELLRQLTGENERLNQFSSFMVFIRENFKLLTSCRSCSKLEITLTNDSDGVNLIANPVSDNGHEADPDLAQIASKNQRF